MDGRCRRDPCQLCATAEERPAGCWTHSEAVAGRPFSAAVGAERGAARSAAVADSSPQTGADPQPGEERTATPGDEPGDAEKSATVERAGTASFSPVTAGGMERVPAERNGISHFIEHMLFKGTTSRSAEAIARSMDSIGGNLDAFTGKELVCFNTKVLDEHLSRAFDVLADLVLHPLFRDEDIEKEKGVILEEIKMEADSPDYLVQEIFSSNFWKDHPLGKPIPGTPETVGKQ